MDLSTQQSLEKRIEDLYSLATTDALTGLNNRRNLLEKIQFEIEKDQTVLNICSRIGYHRKKSDDV